MRTKKGIVTSTKMNKTIVVSVESHENHEKYNKRFKVTTKFYAHDEKGECKTGDVVVIKETKPISKLKRWMLVEKVA